jgi:hypothetical protein
VDERGEEQTEGNEAEPDQLGMLVRRTGAAGLLRRASLDA